MDLLVALIGANILLFWGSEQKILWKAGICPEASGQTQTKRFAPTF